MHEEVAPLWSHFISSAVVPVVIISACGLLCLAFYNRLAAIISRLRSLQRERLQEYKDLFHAEEKKQSSLIIGEIELYLHLLESQTAEVMKKARFIRYCLACLVGAIASLVLCSLFIGLSLYFPPLDYGVLLFFVLGLILMLVGIVYALREIRIVLTPLEMESAFLQKLINDKKS